MSEQALEAVQTAQEATTPAVVENNEAEKGEQVAEQPAETEGEKKPEAKPELSEADKVKAAMQKRIDRQTAASKALQETVRRLEQENQRLAEQAPKPSDAPKQSDFETYDDWEKANIEYHAKKQAESIIKAEKDKELQAAKERQAQEVRRQFDEKEKAYRTLTPDYDQVAGEAVTAMNYLAQAGANIATLRDAVMQFDNPPEMIYQLGKDTSLIDELVSMEPLKLMRELVKLESALSAAGKPVAEQAPEPIKPVSGRGGAKPLHQQTGADILKWVKGK